MEPTTIVFQRQEIWVFGVEPYTFTENQNGKFSSFPFINEQPKLREYNQMGIELADFLRASSGCPAV